MNDDSRNHRAEPAVHVHETIERTHYTYVALYQTASRSLEQAKDNPRGSSYFRMSAGVFAAFTAEAYFNDLGPRVLKFWDQLERLGPQDKAAVLMMQLLGTPIDWGSRPFRSLAEVFRFRNLLAHGQTKTLIIDDVRTVGDATADRDLSENPALQASWEQVCESHETVERFVTDVVEVIEMLCMAHKRDSSAFGAISTFSGVQKVISPAEAELHRRSSKQKKKRLR